MSRCTEAHVNNQCTCVNGVLKRIGLNFEVVPYRSYGSTDLCMRYDGESGVHTMVQGLSSRESYDCLECIWKVLLEVENGLKDGRVRPMNDKKDNNTKKKGE